MNYKIIENFLKDDELKYIENILYSNEFPWYYSKDIVTGNLNNKINIPSIKNNLIMIDGNIPHEIITQTDTDIRLSINITYN